MENPEQPVADNVPKYGLAGDGSYLTPFATTVVYHPKSQFEDVAAFLVDRGQLIPKPNSEDCVEIAYTTEHPSPNVLIFGTDLSMEALQGFFKRGAESIHIFSQEPTAKYSDDSRVVVFRLDGFYDHVNLIPGLLAVYIMEKVILGNFPDYQSNINPNVNPTTGKYFCCGLKANCSTPGAFVLQMCSQYKGFELESQYTFEGRAIIREREKFVKRLIYKYGREYTIPSAGSKCLAVPCYGLHGELMDTLKERLSQVVDFAMLYTNQPKDDADGWRVVLISSDSEKNNAFATLSGVVKNVLGSDQMATAWVSNVNAPNVLPFLY